VIFVHIGDARSRASFVRGGIRLPRARPGRPRGVFAMPVLEDYFASHQWLRELKRGGARTLIGVYFRVPDREAVLVGHYRRDHAPMTAAKAARLIMEAPDARGYQIVIPRKIEADEIQAIRAVHRVVGWRYYPEAKGQKPCGCPACTRGDIRSKRLREAYEAAFRNTK